MCVCPCINKVTEEEKKEFFFHRFLPVIVKSSTINFFFGLQLEGKRFELNSFQEKLPFLLPAYLFSRSIFEIYNVSTD